MPNEIIVATTIGIQKVFRFNPAARAVVITGAMISATTAGRIPIKIAVKVLLDLMVSGVRKMAMLRMMKNDGKIVPRAATKLPNPPLSLSPTTTAILTAKMPGRDCAIASRSINSSFSIQPCRSTTSLSIIEIIAHPPPNVNAPILKNEENSCQYLV